MERRGEGIPKPIRGVEPSQLGEPWPTATPHLSSASFLAMGQGLFRMLAISFFLSSTCSKIRASSSSDRDSPLEVLEATEDDLEQRRGGVVEWRRVGRRAGSSGILWDARSPTGDAPSCHLAQACPAQNPL